MCILAAKYFKEYGWVGAKNRDRNYKPLIHIKQSFRQDVERCLLWDEKTKWTEGINEFGVGILNTTLFVKKDESEGSKSAERISDDVFYSPGGKIVRKALFEKTPKDALNSLIENEMEGFTLVFSKNEAYILEAPVFKDQDEYKYKFIKLDKDKVYVRTNHGILYPEAGYPQTSDDQYMIDSRKSSESRYNIVHNLLAEKNNALVPRDLLRILSSQPYKKDLQLNPLRSSPTHGKHTMVTTGQVLIVPELMTMHYRPIWCDVKFDFNKLDSRKTKTFFELISSNSLINTKSFKEYWKNIKQ